MIMMQSPVRRRREYLTMILMLALLMTAAMAGRAQVSDTANDWPQFRGPNRDGKSAEQGLLTQWPEGGPKLLWSVKGVGKGFTHVSIARGLIYVTGMPNKQGILRAYTLDGKMKWEANYGDEWYASHPGARSIPTVFDGLVYLASGVGNVACFDAADGKPVWSLKMFDQYEAPQVKWGYAESPLIDGDNVIFTPCGKKATMVALNRKTGKQVWASPVLEKQQSSFCSPLMVQHKGKRMIVTMTDFGVVAFAPEDGKPLWQHEYKNFRQNHCVTPIYSDGLLYVTSGYGKGAIGLTLSDDGASVKQIWEQPQQDPVHGHAVLVNGYVYAASHQKSNGKWSCVELKTGKLAWEAPCVGKSGSVIYAGGMLYCYSEDGNVGLVKPSPEKCQVVSKFAI
ncbi:MAG: PQQ-binding-like beta-propeller repeat protein, partial [Candidatus Sumerlaeota bacterium]|nr:PQQ-binding-like beta-propeller repeat protein [Candidatus Sumerlaeota bacterium]